MAEFKYSLAVKGAEAIVAQLRMKVEGEQAYFDKKVAEGYEISAEAQNRHNGYKFAMWDATHALGELKFHEKKMAGKFASKPTAEEIAQHEAELAEYDLHAGLK